MSELIPIGAWVGEPSAHVVFVHGLGGHPYGTWGDVDAAFFWPRWLAEDIPGVRTYSLAYPASPTNWFGTAMPLQDRATNVLERLLGNADLRRAPIVFVCHSFGGLVVKQMLLDLWEQRDRRSEAAVLVETVRGVVFIATPHAGSRQATRLDWLRVLAWPTASTLALTANAPALRKLNVSYRGFADERRAHLKHLVFYEMQPTAAGAIVDESSSDPGLPGSPPIPIDADHMSICKGTSPSDLVVERVRQFVVEIARPQPAHRTEFRAVERVQMPRGPRLSHLAPMMVRVAIVMALVLAGWGAMRGRPGTAMRNQSAPSQITTAPSALTLAGEVLDADTRQPLADVVVRLPEHDMEQRTSATGRYTFMVTTRVGSRVRLVAQREGYRRLEEDPMIGADHVDVLLMERSR